jgi:RNA polymerase sigma factor for flagellar operon FliA
MWRVWVCRQRAGEGLLQYIPDTSENLPSTLLERAELERLLPEASTTIPQIERTVLSLYYQEELTLRRLRRW